MVESKQSTGIDVVVKVDYFSMLQILITVTAWVMRFMKNARASKEQRAKHTTKLQVNESRIVVMEWVKSAQDNLKKQENFKQFVSELGMKEDRGILRCVGKLVNFLNAAENSATDIKDLRNHSP